MQVIMSLIDFILHIDQHLVTMVDMFGVWTYILLFLIVFIETGVVIFPFLPGDSLLFAAGAIAALSNGGLNLPILIILLALAAILGDSMNYFIGSKLGSRIQTGGRLSKVINQEKFSKAEAFFNQHGGKTILIGRFAPFLRTFIPFVAGASRMNYTYFFTYNVIGGSLWVLIGTIAGYFVGNISFIKEHFSVVILAIVVISVIPAFISLFNNKEPQPKF